MWYNRWGQLRNRYYKMSRKYESIAQKKLSAFLSQPNEQLL
jgi:hypothetical protein